MRPHRQQPTRLPCPWDSGKNTGVGCHFLLQCMKVKSESEVAQLCTTLSDPMDCSHAAAIQAPPSMGFSKKEYWSGVPLPSLYLVIIFSSIYHHLICILIYLFVYLLFIPLLYKCHSHRIFVLFSTLSLEKEMATHFSVLAWRISGMGEPGVCRLWGHTESDTTEVT